MMNMAYGVYPELMDSHDDKGIKIEQAIKHLINANKLSHEDTVIVLSDTHRNEYHAPSLHIMKVADYC